MTDLDCIASILRPVIEGEVTQLRESKKQEPHFII